MRSSDWAAPSLGTIAKRATAFCGGSMSAATRDNLVNAVNQVPGYDRLLRIRLAIYLAATCPEGAVQR